MPTRLHDLILVQLNLVAKVLYVDLKSSIYTINLGLSNENITYFLLQKNFYFSLDLKQTCNNCKGGLTGSGRRRSCDHGQFQGITN